MPPLAEYGYPLDDQQRERLQDFCRMRWPEADLVYVLTGKKWVSHGINAWVGLDPAWHLTQSEMRRPTCDQRQKHANNQGDSNHDDRDARDAVRMFADRHLVYDPQQEAAEEYDQDDVGDEIYECVHHGDPPDFRLDQYGRTASLKATDWLQRYRAAA
jgi:hypothetical protein